MTLFAHKFNAFSKRVFGVFLVGLSACATDSIVSNSDSGQSNPLNSKSRLEIIYVSDLHGRLNADSEGLGGWARIASYIQTRKKMAPAQTDVVAILGGDTAGKGAEPCVQTSDLECFTFLKPMGFDFSVLGNGELKKSSVELKKLFQKAQIPFLADNFSSKDPSLAANSYLRYRGAKSGADIFFWTWTQAPTPGSWDPRRAGFEVRNEIHAKDLEKIQSVVGKSSVVWVTHQSIEQDKKFLSNVCQSPVESQVVLLKANDHFEKRENNEFCVPLLEPGAFGRYLLRVVLKPKNISTEGTQWQVEKHEFVAVDSKIPEDETIKKQIDELYLKFGSNANAVIAKTDSELSTDQLGAFAVKAYQKTVRADLAISNRGAFKQGLKPGPITRELLGFAVPYKEDLLGFDISHKELETLLCQAAKRNVDSFLDDGSELVTWGFSLSFSNDKKDCSLVAERKRNSYKVVAPEYIVKRSDRWIGRDIKARTFRFGVTTHRAIELEISKQGGFIR